MYNPISLNKIIAQLIITIRPHILSKVYPLDRLENVYHYSKSLFQLIFQIVFKLIILILTLTKKSNIKNYSNSEAVFLVMCDPSMNEL
jgi:hypothetical protein